MELEEPSIPFTPAQDKRVRMPEPPPVRLVAVSDIELPALAGLETELDRFYIGLLRFERDDEDQGVVYRAENFCIRFFVHELPITREDLRPMGIEVPRFGEVIAKMADAEIEFTKQKGLISGQESLLLQDPAGNWVELFETKPTV